VNYLKCHYSLVQFCPDPSRLEGINIGVLLYCSGTGELRLRLSKHNRRVAQCFGHRDLRFLQRAKKALDEALKREKFSSIAELQLFMGRMANAIQLTPLRPTKIVDIEEDLNALFSRLVEEHVERKDNVQRLLSNQFTKRE
jgi:hypothetical protein